MIAKVCFFDHIQKLSYIINDDQPCAQRMLGMSCHCCSHNQCLSTNVHAYQHQRGMRNEYSTFELLQTISSLHRNLENHHLAQPWLLMSPTRPPSLRAFLFRRLVRHPSYHSSRLASLKSPLHSLNMVSLSFTKSQ